MSVSLPGAFPVAATPGQRASFLIPHLGQNVVQLTDEEIRAYAEQIDALNPPMFFELKGPDSVTLWCLEQDLQWLQKQNASQS